MDDRERLERARRAEELLENETLVEAFELLEHKYLHALRETKYQQELERTQLWHRLKALDALQLELRAMVEDGFLVKLSLEKTKTNIFGR